MRRNQKRGLSYVQAGALAVVALVLITYFGFTKAIPFRHHWSINVEFRTANNIRPNSPVRIAGVNVGKVTQVRHAQPGQADAIVTMRIDAKGRPIHKDATFSIRPRIFLEGNFFVDVRPGTPSAPVLGDGDTVRASQTQTPVQFDQILTTLQSDTRTNLKSLLSNYAQGLADGGGIGFNKSIGYWESAYKNSAIVNDATLGTRPGDLSGYIRGAGTVADALDRSPPALKDLITNLNVTARAFAVEQGNLEATVAELPRTLRAARPAFDALNRAFPPVRRLVVDFRPAVRSSLPAINASLPFITQARKLISQPELRGLVADLRPTVPSLAQLNVNSVPLYQQVRAASSCQNEVILPWSQDQIVDPNFPTRMGDGTVQLKNYEEAVRFLPGIAGESRAGDANGQWFRVLPGNGVNTYSLGTGTFGQSLSPILGTNPGKFARPPLRPHVPCETQTKPDLTKTSPQGPPTIRSSTRTSSASPMARKLNRESLAYLIASLRQQQARESNAITNPAERRQVALTDVKLAALRKQFAADLAKAVKR